MSTVVHQYPHLDTPKRTGTLCLDGVQLLATIEGGVPKDNILSTAELAKVTNHPSYQRRLDVGVIVVQQEAEQTEASEAEDSTPDYSTLEDLSNYNIEGSEDEVGAEDIVAAVSDVELLNLWLAAESRVTLKAIISARVTELS